jgi:hypothetical protein
VSRGRCPAEEQRPARDGGPLRFIGVFTPHGRAYELYRPGPNFDIRYPGCVLAPFDAKEVYGESFKDRLLVLDGVDLAAGIEVGTVGHDASRVILTGSGADGTNASIDQFLAVERGLGNTTSHTSLTLAVGSEGSEIGVNVSYAAGGSPVPKVIDPEKVFDELFGAALTGERGEALKRRRAMERSVLDVVSKDLKKLATRAPRSERLKLEQHTAALREIEKRLTKEPPACALPAAPDPREFPKVRAYGGGERYFERITALQIDLLARALSCDLTRFGTLYLADLSRTGYDPGLPVDVHSDVAHRYAAGDGKRRGDPATWELLARQNRHTYSQVARLLQRLSEGGVLDDCIVYVSSDMGDPARHSSRDVPTLLAGGAGGRFAMGRHVDLRAAYENVPLLPNNRILVSICNAFGVGIDRFGHSANSRTVVGNLAELSQPAV